MGIDSVNNSSQVSQMWQFMASAMNSSVEGSSDSSATNSEGIGQFLGRMEQLRATDSSQLQLVLGQIATQLQGASQQSDGIVGDILGLMAGGFQSASASSDLSSFLSGSPQDSLDSFFSIDGRDPFLSALSASQQSIGTAATFQQLLAWQEAKGSANDIINSILSAQGV